MKKFESILLKAPEYYLIALIALLTFPPLNFWIGFVGLCIISILVLQIIYRNSVIGFILSGLFLLVDLYFLLALLSEFYKFQTINANAIRLIVVGLMIFFFHLGISALMFIHYATRDHHSKAQFELQC